MIELRITKRMYRTTEMKAMRIGRDHDPDVVASLESRRPGIERVEVFEITETKRGTWRNGVRYYENG